MTLKAKLDLWSPNKHFYLIPWPQKPIKNGIICYSEILHFSNMAAGSHLEFWNFVWATLFSDSTHPNELLCKLWRLYHKVNDFSVICPTINARWCFVHGHWNECTFWEHSKIFFFERPFVTVPHTNLSDVKLTCVQSRVNLTQRVNLTPASN